MDIDGKVCEHHLEITEPYVTNQMLHVLCGHAGYLLTIKGCLYQPGNPIRSFVSPNEVKVVYFDCYQQFDVVQNKYDGEWFESVHIDEDIHRWHAERYLPSIYDGVERCPVLGQRNFNLM